MSAPFPLSLSLGDIDGDGRIDAVTANRFSNDVSILLGQGDGSFAPQRSFTVGSGKFPRTAGLGDVNRDGHIDVISANWPDNNAGDISVLLAKATATLRPIKTFR